MIYDTLLNQLRMFSSSLQEEARAIEDHIKAVKDKIQDVALCEKVRQFVYAPKEIQEIYRADAGRNFVNM